MQAFKVYMLKTANTKVININNIFIKTTILFFILLILSGCAEPKILYKEVLIPVKCTINMPSKPLNKQNFESKKALMIYYLEVENLLKGCTGE